MRAGRIPFSKLDAVSPRISIASCRGSEWRTCRRRRSPISTALAPSRRLAGRIRGLHLLKRHFLLAPVFNGNISLMVDLARRNDWRWDAIRAPRSPVTTSPSRGSTSRPRKRSTCRRAPGCCRGAHQRPRPRGGLRLAHRPCGAAQRARPRPRRGGARKPMDVAVAGLPESCGSAGGEQVSGGLKLWRQLSPCVDGSWLASAFSTRAVVVEQPCVRPALTAPTSMALVAPVEKPSTASAADMPRHTPSAAMGPSAEVFGFKLPTEPDSPSSKPCGR